MRKSRLDEYIPIKIEGWNGKFARSSEPPRIKPDAQRSQLFETLMHNPKTPQQQQQQHHRQQEQKKKEQQEQQEQQEQYEQQQQQQQQKTHAQMEPGVRYYTEAEYNRAMQSGRQSSDFYGHSNEVTVLPTVWSGKFETDPTDVRIKPERNNSDVRDYGDRWIHRDD